MPPTPDLLLYLPFSNHTQTNTCARLLARAPPPTRRCFSLDGHGHADTSTRTHLSPLASGCSLRSLGTVLGPSCAGAGYKRVDAAHHVQRVSLDAGAGVGVGADAGTGAGVSVATQSADLPCAALRTTRRHRLAGASIDTRLGAGPCLEHLHLQLEGKDPALHPSTTLVLPKYHPSTTLVPP